MLKRVFDLLAHQQNNNPLDTCLATKVNGSWISYSTEEVIRIVNQISRGLSALGIRKDDKIAIISNNRPEWNFIDLGMQQLGAVSVPMYPTITEKDYNYIFKDAGVKMVFVSDKKLYEKVGNSLEGLRQIPEIYTFDTVEGARNWKEICQSGEEHPEIDLEPLKAAVQADDLLTLIYTSGTTGSPKGVMLTHWNVLSNAISVSKVIPDFPRPLKSLSFLPLSHIFERTTVYFYLLRGISVYYAESIDSLSENLKEVQPIIFATVPRLLEKVYDKIIAKGYEQKGIKKQLFFWAVKIGQQYNPQQKQSAWYRMQLKLANKVIFSKWREALGGKVKLIASGGAALQPRLATIFWAAEIRVLEAYGLTETSPGIAFNGYEPEDMRIGTVGLPMDQVKVKIAQDGEILVKGPNVMKGYYNRPEQTAEAIDAEGWFHTGDIGEFVEGRFLKITDRKKEMFKTSGGKYVAPQAIENKFSESLLIEQIMVVGEGEKFPAALVVPNFQALRDWSVLHDIPYTTDEEMIRHPKVLEKFTREQERLNEGFAQYEKIKKIKLLTKPWTIEAGEVTAKLSLKRKVITQNHAADIRAIYETDN